eukprot:TRINITY_DN8170_c0_g4_i1.p1 TRINITY_DN8170_c0_g4~~TRINITY_DN8170_c0_g4_i1.p1  ORF type:complete len:191 (+),score=56.49 TRINITY_DN8170_c0_g4_i1:38-610(+)
MIRRPPRSTQSRSSAASDVYKRQLQDFDPDAPMSTLSQKTSTSNQIEAVERTPVRPTVGKDVTRNLMKQDRTDFMTFRTAEDELKEKRRINTELEEEVSSLRIQLQQLTSRQQEELQSLRHELEYELEQQRSIIVELEARVASSQTHDPPSFQPGNLRSRRFSSNSEVTLDARVQSLKERLLRLSRESDA